MRFISRVVTSVSVTALFLTGFATVGVSSAGAQVPAPAIPSVPGATIPGIVRPPSTLAWKRCEPATLVPASLECATLNLAVNDDNEAAGRFDLQVTRSAARKPAERIGTLFLNPGGPGGSTISFLINETIRPGGFSDAILDRFDLIAFDPRGVIRSNGVTCNPKGQPATAAAAASTQASVDAFFETQQENRPQTRPLNARQRAIILGNAARTAQSCLDNENLAFLQSVNTKNVAGDMDQLRTALGEEKISFLGFSYGTFLGATYGALYPEHVRALVLDGALPASKFVNDPFRINIEQTASANQILLDVFGFCQQAGQACPFGNGDPLTAFRNLVRTLDQQPLAIKIGDQSIQINGTAITGVARSFMGGSPKGWPELLTLLAAAERRDPLPFQQPETDSGPPSFSDAAFLVTVCNDEDFPSDLEAWDEVYDELFQVAPDFAILNIFATVECAFLDYDKDPYTGPFNSDAIPTVLVVGGTKDSQTPYAWAQELTQELGNARLLTFDGYGHVSYRPDNVCIQEHVNTFLLTGSLPAAGTVCTQTKLGSA